MSAEPESPEPQSDPPAPEPRDRDRRPDGRPENARPRDRFGAPLPRDAEDEMPDRVEPEDICDSVDMAIDHAVDLFDEERFFEAHEFFEWAWKGPVTPEEDRTLFKGLAQVAVGYTHTQRGNETGARTLLQRGIGNIAGYQPSAYEVDLATVARDAEAMVEWLADNPATPEAVFPRFPPRGQST